MKKFFPVYVRVPLLFFAIFGAMEYFIESGDQPAFIKYPITIFVLFVILLMIIAFEAVMYAVDNIVYQMMTDAERQKLEEAKVVGLGQQQQWYKNLMHRLTGSEPVENNSQLLLDHDYDGIKELDNNLPPWWIYLFYGCIVFAGIYMVRFELMGGDNQETELKNEMAQAKIDVAEYMKNAPDRMDESKVTLLTSAPELASGKAIFMTNCMACHRADGGGQIGPNLTDQHWIFGGDIKNVFRIITNGGRDGKGMVAWKATLKPTEIQHVASYILSLQGTNPKDPKAPDGDLWNPETKAMASAEPTK